MKGKIQYGKSLKIKENKVGDFWHSAYQCKQLKYDLVYAELRKAYEEIQQLKQSQKELAELKQKAIVPKFQLGQILYMIPTQFNGLTKIKDYELLSISLSDIGIRYSMVVNKKERGIEVFYDASENMFGESIFATKEEAEQKLAEIRGKGE